MMRGSVRRALLGVGVGAALLGAIGTANADPVPGAWHSIGWPMTVTGGSGLPIAGRVSALAIRPGHPATELAGTLGGIWKRAGTGPWTDVTSSSWPATAISSLAVDPTRTSIVYAGTGADLNTSEPVQPGAGVLKSTNGGNTWKPLRRSEGLMRGNGVTGLVVDPRDHQVVVAAANNGLFRSADGGAHWKKELSLPNLYSFPEVRLAVDPTTGHMLAGVSETFWIRAHQSHRTVKTDHAMYVSTDGGRRWTPYVVDSSSGGGQLLIPGLATTHGRHPKTYAYALDVGNAGVTGLYTSTNTRTWKRKTKRGVDPDLYIGQLVVNPKDPRTAYFATLSRPYQYSFGSSTAVRVKNDACDWLDFRSMAIGPSLTDGAHSALYYGDDGASCSVDLVNHAFSEDNRGMISGLDYGLSAQSPSLEITARQDLGVSVYSGGSGSVEVDGTDAWEALIDRQSPSTFYAATHQNSVGFDVSTDSGAQWHTLALSPHSQLSIPPTLTMVQPAGDPNLIILPNGTGQLYVSSDDGKNWQVRQVPVRGDALTSIDAARFPGASRPVIYAGSDGGKLWRSTDLGASWTRLSKTFPLYVSSIALDPGQSTASRRRVYVGLGSKPFAYANPNARVGDVWQSNNGGGSWTEIGKSLKRASVNTLALGGATLLAGTDFGVEKFHAGTWSPAGRGLPRVKVTGLQLTPDGNAFFASTYGRGTWVATAVTGP